MQPSELDRLDLQNPRGVFCTSPIASLTVGLRGTRRTARDSAPSRGADAFYIEVNSRNTRSWRLGRCFLFPCNARPADTGTTAVFDQFCRRSDVTPESAAAASSVPPIDRAPLYRRNHSARRRRRNDSRRAA